MEVHPSGCARCSASAGCSAIKYQSLSPATGAGEAGADNAASLLHARLEREREIESEGGRQRKRQRDSEKERGGGGGSMFHGVNHVFDQRPGQRLSDALSIRC